MRVRVCGIRASHDEAEVDVDEVALAVEEQVAVVAVLDREHVAHLVRARAGARARVRARARARATYP